MKSKLEKPVVVARTFDASAEKIWQAITDKNQMKLWYFDLPEFRAEVGFEFQFPGGPSPEKQYLHLCKITEAVPGKKLTYSWRYDGHAGESFVTFLLTPKSEKTVLRVTHRGLETFPQDNPDLAKGEFTVGWKEIIGTNLKKFLA